MMHVVSSTLVCFNSARLVRFGEEPAFEMEAALRPGAAPAMPKMAPAVAT